MPQLSEQHISEQARRWRPESAFAQLEAEGEDPDAIVHNAVHRINGADDPMQALVQLHEEAAALFRYRDHNTVIGTMSRVLSATVFACEAALKESKVI